MIYFISDAHLGSRVIADPVAHQQRLVELLTRMGEDAEEIFLLGDIFDFWYETFWPSSRESKRAQFGAILDCLKSLTDKGIAVHFFIGNHDIWTFGWLAHETGVTVHRKAESLSRYGRRLYMGHGDGIVPSNIMSLVPAEFRSRIRRFRILRAFFHFRGAQYLFRLMPTKYWDEMGYEWARRSRLKEMAHPCGYKGEDKEELVLFAKEQETRGQHHDYYIFGHRHIELQLMLSSGSQVVILGDFFENFTYAQLSQDGQLALMNME